MNQSVLHLFAGKSLKTDISPLQPSVTESEAESTPTISHSAYQELKRAAAQPLVQTPDAAISSTLKGFRKAQDNFRDLNKTAESVSAAEYSLRHQQLLERLAARAEELARVINQHVGYRSTIKYEVLPMDRHHLDEILTGVKYFTELEQEASKLTIKNGKIYDAQGMPFNTTSMLGGAVSQQAPMSIFVMDERGNFYASNFYQRHVLQHSSLIQGRPVAFAGEMAVSNGELLRLGDRSGHYFLPPPFRRQVLNELITQKVNLQKVDFKFQDAAAILMSPLSAERDALAWDDRLASVGANAMLAEFEIYKRRAHSIYEARLMWAEREDERMRSLLIALRSHPKL